MLEPLLKEIEASPAYKSGGLIAVTFDQAPQSGPHADASACCSTPAYPNMPVASTTSTTSPTSTSGQTLTSSTGSSTSAGSVSATTPTGATSSTGTTTSTSSTGAGNGSTPTGGGGQVGLLLISRYIKPGTSDVVDQYNHYSLLASIENIFGLPRLGYAGQSGLAVLDAGVFNAPA